jgi:hypothetical protein
MNFEFAEQVNPHLRNGDFSKALEVAGRKLKKMPVTDYHRVLGNSLLHNADALINWIEEFFQRMSETME